MRPGQNGKRSRGRGRGGNKPHNVLNRTFESNGPDVKVRGTASHIYEKYQSLARDASASGDRVMAENYLQHAEHYYRIIAAAQASMPQQQPGQNGQHQPRTDGGHGGGNGPQPFVAGEDDDEGDDDMPQPEAMEQPAEADAARA